MKQYVHKTGNYPTNKLKNGMVDGWLPALRLDTKSKRLPDICSMCCVEHVFWSSMTLAAIYSTALLIQLAGVGFAE